jgi:hypothetical protein
MASIYSQTETLDAPLVVDAIYKGASIEYDPMHKLLGVANMGGFRKKRTDTGNGYSYVVLYSSLDDIDWPDSIDYFTGLVTYFGDNKSPGAPLHETSLGGNAVLRDVFNSLHNGERRKIPPFFMFTKAPEERDVQFRGLLIPGSEALTSNEDLVAIWKIKNGKRFQNYRSSFSVLDEQIVNRAWINDLLAGHPESDNAPVAWLQWRKGAVKPKVLRAESVRTHRTKAEQLPASKSDSALLDVILDHFKDSPHAFELFAAELFKLMDRNVSSYTLTRKTMDGGRDAYGHYKIGLNTNSINVDFALEAKCYSPSNSVTVKETSRLISRLRHRQFGVLVTTSFLAEQAYKELIEDAHPVVVMSASDIVSVLRNHGYHSPEQVAQFAKQTLQSYEDGAGLDSSKI